MTLLERTLKTQKAELKKAHNERYMQSGYEFRLIYEGGLAEFFSVMGRRKNERNFKYITGFSAYKFMDKEQVLTHAKALTSQKVKNL